MDIRDLRFFSLTAELEHVTRAAEKLGVSQPFLTRVISNLEKEIGLALFDNVGRKIRLNENGENFYAYAKKVLSAMDELQIEVGSMLNRHNQSIRVLCNMTAYSHELIVAFRKKYPNYTISIEFAPIKEIMNALTIGEADFSFCSPPIPDDPLKGVKSEIAFREKGMILLPPSHPLLGKERIGFEDLKNEHLLTTSKGSALRINIERVFKKYEFHPNIILESNDMELIIRGVRDGMGYAVIPLWLVHSRPELKAFCKEADVPDAHAYIGISYSTSPAEGEACLDFKSFALEFLNNFRLKSYSNS